MFGNPKLLFWITLAGALIVGGILVLATNKWWAVFIPLVLHGVGTALVTKGVFKLLDERDKPDPVTQARLDEEGETPATS
jgi:membrane protein implicated in regulation of membrane protease activity